MKPATCPVWSATTWTPTSGAMCPLCLSLWQPMQEQCTMGKYIFQASHFSVFLYKAIARGTSLTPMCLSFTGGVHNGEYVPWLYCYDPVMDVWARKQDMNTKRAIHTLAVMNDRLYAIGGNHLKGVFLFVCWVFVWFCSYSSTICTTHSLLQGFLLDHHS